MKKLSIVWGNQANSPVSKLNRGAAFKNYHHYFGDIFILEQMHGVAGQVVSRNDGFDVGYVAKGDYLITNQTNISLGVLTADCLPIVFFCPVKQVIAIAHAGWRGSVAGIAQVVLKRLMDEFGVVAANLKIFFGPAAGVCCYQVDRKFVDDLKADPLATKSFKQKGESYFFDNSQYNMLCLQKLGVHLENINLSDNICTICTLGYCSYRKFGDQTCLQLSVVSLSQ